MSLTYMHLIIGRQPGMSLTMHGSMHRSLIPTWYPHELTMKIKTGWTTITYNVSSAAGLSNSSYTKFIGCSFATSDFSTSGFSPEGAFSAGLLDSPPGSLITEFVTSENTCNHKFMFS
jgi:hypothetical protein